MRILLFLSKIDFCDPKMVTTELTENRRRKSEKDKGMDGLKL